MDSRAVSFSPSGLTLDEAIRLAQSGTGRRRVLRVAPPLARVCRELAFSDQRLAALVVIPDLRDLTVKAFLRKLRELASAEGAWLIIDDTGGSPGDWPGLYSDIRPDILVERKNAGAE
jgi:glutamate-1-semialdehyde aminotransferase